MAPVHMERGIRWSSETWVSTYFSAPGLFHRGRQGNCGAHLDDRALDARARRVHRPAARARNRAPGRRPHGPEITPDAVVLGRRARSVAARGRHRVRAFPRPGRLPAASAELAE